MTLKYGPVDCTTENNCPEHCLNCEFCSSETIDNGFSDGFGGVTDYLEEYTCSASNLSCPSDAKDCYKMTHLPELCLSCPALISCVFDETPVLDFCQYLDCVNDCLDQYLDNLNI